MDIYDTVLRDGSQLEGISLTVEDKLKIAAQLDRLGVHYIEGGWPGANPKDVEFFTRAADELELTTSKLVAFGSTRRAKGKTDSDPTLANLLESGTGTREKRSLPLYTVDPDDFRGITKLELVEIPHPDEPSAYIVSETTEC